MTTHSHWISHRAHSHLQYAFQCTLFHVQRFAIGNVFVYIYEVCWYVLFFFFHLSTPENGDTYCKCESSLKVNLLASILVCMIKFPTCYSIKEEHHFPEIVHLLSLKRGYCATIEWLCLGWEISLFCWRQKEAFPQSPFLKWSNYNIVT